MSSDVSLRSAYYAALRGDFTRLQELTSAPEWRTVAQTIELGMRGSEHEVVLPETASPIAVLGLARMHRLAVVGGDAEGAAKALAKTREAITTVGETIHASLLRVRALVLDDPQKGRKHAQALAVRASKEGAAEVVLEASGLRALATLPADPAEGLRLARRTARMARTEGLLEEEYFAYTVLARARRMVGQSAVASRVLQTLSRVCPAPWRRWVDWERAMLGEEPETEPAHALWQMRVAARDGSRQLAKTANTLESQLNVAHLRSDARIVRRVLDPDASIDDLPWSFSEASLPPALHGLARPRSDTDAIVVHFDGGTARRYLGDASGLLRARGASIVVGEGRPDTALIAVLAMAGADGLDIDTLFRAVFGVRRVPDRHDGQWRTTLYRARAALGDLGEIARIGERLVLRTTQAIIIPDRAAEASLDDTLLFGIASLGGRASAKALAESLEVPLRTVQDALRRLVDDGACARIKAGRRIEYALEDTTCYDPTLHRLRPS